MDDKPAQVRPIGVDMDEKTPHVWGAFHCYQNLSLIQLWKKPLLLWPGSDDPRPGLQLFCLVGLPCRFCVQPLGLDLVSHFPEILLSKRSVGSNGGLSHGLCLIPCRLGLVHFLWRPRVDPLRFLLWVSFLHVLKFIPVWLARRSRRPNFCHFLSPLLSLPRGNYLRAVLRAGR